MRPAAESRIRVARQRVTAFLVDSLCLRPHLEGVLNSADIEEVRECRVEILTPSGWRWTTHVLKTVPMQVFRLTTASYELEAAFHHLVGLEHGGFAQLGFLRAGDRVRTDSGVETVTAVEDTGRVESLYDLRVDDPGHSYYSNGILSHNSSGIGTDDLFRLNSIPKHNGLYVAPMKEHVKTYADRLALLEMSSSFPKRAKKGLRTNLYYKESKLGGSLRLMHVMDDVTKVRGQTIDHTSVDECFSSLTAISVPGGSVAITDVVSGQPVLGFDRRNRVVEDRVLRLVSRGCRHTWTVTTSGGYAVTCTGNSRLKTSGGWIYVADLLTYEECRRCYRSSLARDVGVNPVTGDRHAELGFRVARLPPDSDLLVLRGGTLESERITNVEYAGVQDVWDVETEQHHTLFANNIAAHNCQNFNADLLYEIMVTMKDSEFASMTVAGTSLDKSTFLEQSFQAGSRGFWMIPNNSGKWYSLGDPLDIKKLMHVDGLKCPETKKILNPGAGMFVHESPRQIDMGFPSFHLPQIIVPAYARGKKWMEIYRDYTNPQITETQFMREAMGIPTEDGLQELTEEDLKACCDESMTFAKFQADMLADRTRYLFVSSGADWGGSDPKVQAKMKLSYTVHSMLGVKPNGMMDCLHIRRFPSKDYREIGGEIVLKHRQLQGNYFSADNGGGNYYNVHVRDSGQIPITAFLIYNYSDNLKEFLSPIDHPSFNLFSLSRTDSLSMLFEIIKSRRIRFPRWSESGVFLTDLLNIVRNITSSETTGRKLTRYIRIANRADDTAHSLNYALTTARIALQEPGIPDRHVVQQVMQAGQAPSGWAPTTNDTAWQGYSDVGYFSG